ncbi:MAG: hypothetical protein M3286_04560 [Thermoproteota archaeon]|nr:hypothetical protein [Thermoproteota archaeon]
MPIAQSKRKLIAATALFIAVGALTGAIATGGAATISFAQTEDQAGGGGGATTTGQQQGGGGGGQERIVREGTITSQPNPLPGLEEEQVAIILPLRQDGSVYSGVITYTASVPVDVVIPIVQTLNASERSMLNVTEEEDGFGTIATSPLDNETSITWSTVTPAGGDTPVASASIPFTGNALWLHTSEATPFVASYAVSAQVLPAEAQNNISNATLATAATEAGAEEEEAGAEEEAAGAEEEAAGAEEEEAAGAAEEEAAGADGGGDTEGADADEGGTTAGGGGTTGGA